MRYKELIFWTLFYGEARCLVRMESLDLLYKMIREAFWQLAIVEKCLYND